MLNKVKAISENQAFGAEFSIHNIYNLHYCGSDFSAALKISLGKTKRKNRSFDDFYERLFKCLPMTPHG